MTHIDRPRTATCHILGSRVKYWQYHPEKSPVIIAIHGFRGTHHGLEFIVRELPEFRVVIPDLPGFGDSEPLGEAAHSLESYAEVVKQFIIQLDLKTPPVLLGHSFGSIVAARVAAEAPDLISQLILLNPIAAHGATRSGRYGLVVTRIFYGAGWRLPPMLGKKLLASGVATRLMNVLLTQTTDRKRQARIRQHHARHFSRFASPRMVHEAFIASSKHTVADHADKIFHPTLLVAGGRDGIVPLPAQQRLVRLFPDARLAVIDQTGHLMHYETPEEAARVISDFLG